MNAEENATPQPPQPAPSKPRISPWRWIIYGVALVLGALIAVPNFVKSRGTACKNACINNLRQIDLAMEQWSLENKLSQGTPADQAAISQYIKGGSWPVCPGGGFYTAQPLGLPPLCSMGHTL